MNAWLVAFLACVILFTAVAMLMDVRWCRIPNWLSVSAFAAGLLFHLVLGSVEGGVWGALDHLRVSLLGFALGFGILFVVWMFGWGGGGDVKLMGAIGAWVGPLPILFVFILSTFFQIVGVVAYFLYRSLSKGMRRSFEEIKNASPDRQTKPRDPKKAARARQRLQPYAVSAALATWVVVLISAYGATSSTRYWQSHAAEAQPAETMSFRTDHSPSLAR